MIKAREKYITSMLQKELGQFDKHFVKRVSYKKNINSLALPHHLIYYVLNKTMRGVIMNLDEKYVYYITACFPILFAVLCT